MIIHCYNFLQNILSDYCFVSVDSSGNKSKVERTLQERNFGTQKDSELSIKRRAKASSIDISPAKRQRTHSQEPVSRSPSR